MRLITAFSINLLVVSICLGLSPLAASAQGFAWAQGFGTGSNVAGLNQLAFDSNHNIVAASGLAGTVDFDKGPGVYNLTAVGNIDMVLMKEDASGAFLWAKHVAALGNSGNTFIHPLAISLDAASNIYITGAFRDSFDFDPGPSVYKMASVGNFSNAVLNVFILKLTATGDFVWAKQIGNTGLNNASAHGIKLDATGNIYTTTNFSGIIDADPGPNTVNFSPGGVLVNKFDPAGNFIWAKHFPQSQVKSFAIDSTANLYFTGGFGGTVDFDPGAGVFNLISVGPTNVFINKLDSAGNFQWAKRIGINDDWGQGISVDRFGNVLVTGYCASGIVDFDPGPGVYNITNSSRDMFTLRLRNNGDFSWARSVHPGGNDDGRAIATDTFGNVYTTGEFFGGGDFDPGPDVYGLSGGVYVQKLDSSGNFQWARSWGADIPGWIGLDKANDVYVTGVFSGNPVDFDPGPGTFNLIGNNAGFIEKLCGSSLILAANDSTICSGGSAQLTTPSMPGAIYAWTMDGNIIPGSSNTINVNQAGAYEVFVNGGCPSASGPVYISVTPTLQPTISNSGPSGELVGQPVTINANVGNAGPSYSIDWKNKGVWFATTTVPSVTYTKQAGADTITAFIISTSPGCYDSTLSNTHRVYDATGITETMNAEGIKVYPNPFHNMIAVEGLKVRDKLILVDMMGRNVQCWQATEPTQVFPISDLSAGHYVLKIMNDKGEVRVNVPVVKR